MFQKHRRACLWRADYRLIKENKQKYGVDIWQILSIEHIQEENEIQLDSKLFKESLTYVDYNSNHESETMFRIGSD
mgnify:CR=1 FL=1